MIYLIKSACFKNINDKKCNEYETILKIGYTKDNSRKSRFKIYITENPGAQILYLIPGGTVEDESNLHQYFKKYLKYGREWFSYNSEIIQFFKIHTTKESLRELNYLRKDLRSLVEDKYFYKILSKLVVSNPKLYFKIKDELYDELDKILITVDDLDSYFKSIYPDIDFDEINIPVIQNEFINSFKSEFRSDENFVRRMKMYYRLVTEFSDIYKQNIKIFNSIIPISYQGYMNLLGPSRIKANGYIEADIRNEANSVLDHNEVKAEILLKFVPGNKYSSKSIKQTLGVIFDKLGLSKTPKASDLEEYFELKECKVLNKETGKWDRGFEIIKNKEEGD